MVVIAEPWWCESHILHIAQAMSRASRLGQTKTVYLWRVSGRNSMIDAVIQSSVNLRKDKVVQHHLMEALRMPDSERRRIPEIYKRTTPVAAAED